MGYGSAGLFVDDYRTGTAEDQGEGAYNFRYGAFYHVRLVHQECLLAALGSATGLCFFGFLGVNGDAVDPRAGGFEGGDLASAKILAEYVVGNSDGFFLLKGDGLKSGVFDQVQVLVFLNGTGDATGVHFSGFADFRGQFADQDYIGNAEVAAGLQDAVYLLKDAVFVGDEVQDAVGDDDV